MNTTNRVKIINAKDEGLFDRDDLIQALVNWLSEDEAGEFLENYAPDFVTDDDDEDEMTDEERFDEYVDTQLVDPETYDLDAMRLDFEAGNFDLDTDDPEDYDKQTIVRTSMTNGQFKQARNQCDEYGLDYEEEYHLWKVEKSDDAICD